MIYSKKPVANTILVEDVSSSMDDRIKDHSGKQRKKIEILKDANLALLAHKIRHCPQDLVGCVVFSDKASVLFKLTKPNSIWASTRIKNMRVGGMTNMAAGLSLGVKLLEGRKKCYLSNIILLSDGFHNVGSANRVYALASIARQKRINIHTIGFGDDSDSFDESLLKHIAKTTFNGKYMHVRELDKLSKTLIEFS